MDDPTPLARHRHSRSSDHAGCLNDLTDGSTSLPLTCTAPDFSRTSFPPSRLSSDIRRASLHLAPGATSTHILPSCITRADALANPDLVSIQIVVSAALAALGITALGIAVACERAMQRHRQPGVTYREVTLRKDGGWRRGDLFTDTGLRDQRRASSFGVTGAVLLLASLLAYVLLAGG